MKKYTNVLIIIGLVAFFGYSVVHAEKEPTLSEKKAMVKSAKISMTDAIAIATKKIPGTIIDSELESENGKNIYSFELVPTTGNIINEVNVNSADGTIVSVEDANADDPSEKSTEKKETDKKEAANEEQQDKAEKQALAKAAKISMTDAIGIASKKATGTVIDAELETSDGKTIYTMEVLPDSSKAKTTKRVTLDATSGAVLSTKNLTAAVITKEKAAEKADKD